MKFSSYYFKARLLPTIITIIPLLILVNVVIAPMYHDSLKDIINVLPILSNLGLSAALLFLMVQINRFVAKEVFQRIYFKDEIFMPTTTHLLWEDTFFDMSVKKSIRLKIESMFGITLMNIPDESSDELTSRRQIVTAVSQIRNLLRNNSLLLQHNIEYGFIRNLIGGSLISDFFSLILSVVGLIKHVPSLTFIGILLVIIYLIPLLFSKLIVSRYGHYYSKVLYEQFLTIK